MAKKKLTPIVTPVGELFYVNIEGQGKENYNEDGYEYVATIQLSGAASEEIRKQIDEEIGEIKKNESLKSKGYRQMMVDAEGNKFKPTNKKKDGELIDLYEFSFKTSTVFEDGKTKKIKVYNKDNVQVSLNGKKVGNGSVGAISGKMARTVYKDEVSCSLYLNAIQLTKFEEYSEEAGFGQQDGEFEGVEDDETGFVGQPVEDSEDSAPEKSSSKTKVKL